jgi:hypothetical protein
MALACALLAQQAALAQPAAPAPPAPLVADDPFATAPQATSTARAPQPAAAPSAPAGGKLDIEAMRHSVREVLESEDVPSGPMGTVFSAAPAPQLQRFKNKFDEGKRPWCLTAFQGAGVLALVAMPLAILLDKKDHGCKW